ncbi:hypothetical protein AnigIFM63309_011243 [Aspergillus niger]|nr:hypothetical protein AnigIFM63309_011243 [Aspergillus niger]
MNQSATAAPWAQGAEKYRGKRLLPHVIDYFARQEPERVFACISMSSDFADGFRDVTMQDMAAAVNRMARCTEQTFRRALHFQPRQKVLAYIGPSNLRHTILFMAAIMCGTQVRAPINIAG